MNQGQLNPITIAAHTPVKIKQLSNMSLWKSKMKGFPTCHLGVVHMSYFSRKPVIGGTLKPNPNKSNPMMAGRSGREILLKKNCFIFKAVKR